MKKNNRLIALLLAVAMLFSLSGCSVPIIDDLCYKALDYVRCHGTSFEDMEYVRPESDALQNIVDEICNLLDSDATYGEVTEALDRFYDEYWSFNTMYTLASIRSDLDTSDSYYADEYEYCSEIDADVSVLFTELMYRCADSSLADELDEKYFSGMLADDYSDEHSDDYDKLNGLYAQESALLTKYRKLLVEFNSSDSDYETYNEEMCEIYIDLVKVRHKIAEELGYDSYEEMAYSDFGREYSPEDVEEYLEAVREYIVPLYIEALESNVLRDAYYGLGASSPQKSLSIVCNTVSSMDSSFRLSARFMNNYNLYDVSVSENKLPSSYTTYISNYDAPFLFVCSQGYEEDILTIAHEFGHFTDSYCNYNGGNSLDTSEVLSQGLEYLLLCYLDDGYLSERLAKYKMTDTIFLHINQACFNDFEHRVFSLPEDELTVDKVNSIYADCATEYGFGDAYSDVGITWVNINHFFEYPFYVISYCVSDSVAFSMYCMELENEGAGLAAYLQVLKGAADVDFLELVESAGIGSPLSADTVKDIARVIKSTLEM